MARQRRGRGEGGIHRRKEDGLWMAYLSLGFDGQGKPKRKVVYGTTKAEVQGKLRQLQQSAAQGILSDTERLTVAAFLDRWLENTIRAQVQPNTHRRYEQVVRLRIKPHLGGIRLDKLVPLHIEQWYADLQREEVSARGQQMAGLVLGRALRDAIRLRLLLNNPVRDVAKPKPSKRKMQVLDSAGVARFLKAAETDRLYALYVLVLDTGMRQGEVFALQWVDVEFALGTVMVQRSLEEISGKVRLKETKTGHGRRIEVTPFTLTALQDHRKKMLQEGHTQGPVFCDHLGGWLRKSNVVQRSFQAILARANDQVQQEAEKTDTAHALLPRLRFHDLRHTAATLLLLAGVHPKIVSERLGHASIELTLNTYSHVLPTMQKMAVEQMAKVFSTCCAEAQ